MKLLTKIGVATLLGVAALATPTDVSASNVEAHADFAAIVNVQAVAKVENDRIKLNCINDKLVLAKAVLNIIDAGDNSKIGQLHELRAAAEACAGKRQINSESNNSFTAPIGPVQPPENPGGLDWGVTFEPPVNASPSTPTMRHGMSAFRVNRHR